MEKRQPLSVMIALQSKKLRGDSAEKGAPAKEPDDDDTDESSDPKYDDEGMLSASEDMIDAFKNRDAKALNTALCHWMEMHATHGEAGADDEGDKN